MRIFELFDDEKEPENKIGTVTKGGFIAGRELWKGISGQGTSSYNQLKKELGGEKNKKSIRIDDGLDPKDRFDNLIERVYSAEKIKKSKLDFDQIKLKIFNAIKQVQKIEDKDIAKKKLEIILKEYIKLQENSKLDNEEKEAFKELAGIK